MAQERVVDTTAAVERDLKHHCHHVDRDEFLKEVISVDLGLVNSVYKSMVEQGHYDRHAERWKQYPLTVGQEIELYEPFCMIANAIGVAARKRNGRPNQWVPTDRSGLQTASLVAGESRPDIVNVSCTNASMEALGREVVQAGPGVEQKLVRFSEVLAYTFNLL